MSLVSGSVVSDLCFFGGRLFVVRGFGPCVCVCVSSMVFRGWATAPFEAQNHFSVFVSLWQYSDNKGGCAKQPIIFSHTPYNIYISYNHILLVLLHTYILARNYIIRVILAADRCLAKAVVESSAGYVLNSSATIACAVTNMRCGEGVGKFGKRRGEILSVLWN